MKLTVKKVYEIERSGLATALGEDETGDIWRFSGDWRPMRDIEWALNAGEHPEVDVEQHQLIKMLTTHEARVELLIAAFDKIASIDLEIALKEALQPDGEGFDCRDANVVVGAYVRKLIRQEEVTDDEYLKAMKGVEDMTPREDEDHASKG